MVSTLAEQITSIPQRLAGCKDASAEAMALAKKTWLDIDPHVVLTVARGTSDAAAAHAARLFLLELGVPVCSFAPSLATMDGYRHNGKHAVALGISQSGESPDLVRALESFYFEARWSMTNVDGSPLERASSVRIPIGAGTEQSVAATKSFACSLLQLALLVSALGGKNSVDCDTCAAAAERGLAEPLDMGAFVNASSVFVLGRGATLPLAQEAALKFKEAAGLHAEALSSAEVMHGPKALAVPNIPVIAFAPPGKAGMQVAASAGELEALGSSCVLLRAKNGEGELEAVLRQLASFYVALLSLADARGVDPDAPTTLTKVTRTY